MITTASKFFYGLAGLLLVAAIAYGYSTGGGGVGPLSLGYKGGVGDLLGYSILVGGAAVAALLGFTVTAVRDADPEATAELLGADAPPAATAPATASYWPIVGAFGVGLTVIGVVLNNVFFVAGLIALGAVAIEWTMQNWSERATGDPAVNREIRNRLMLPLEVPIAGALVVAVVIIGYSRVFLAVSKENAVWIAIGLAASIFLIGAVLSTRDRIRTDLIAGILAVAAVLTIGFGVVGAVSGEREFEHHGDEGHEETEHEDSQDDHAPASGEESEDAPAEESN